METKINYVSIVPHDNLLHAFLKCLEKELNNAGFNRSFEHMDPGGVDIYRYQSKEGVTVMIVRTQRENDKEELKISSEWNGLSNLIEDAADNFGCDIARMIKGGRLKK